MFITKYKLFISSSLVFIVLNTIENFIHFTIGRSVDTKDKLEIKASLPTKNDIIKIVVIMIIFAILNSAILCYIDSC